MSRYTQNLYDVGSFLDRNIPTRNEFFGMVGSPKAPISEGVPYEDRLKNMFPPTLQPMSLEEQVAAHAQKVAEFQKQLAASQSSQAQGQESVLGDSVLAPDSILAPDSVLAQGFSLNGLPRQNASAPPHPHASGLDSHARDNMRAEAAARAGVAAGPKDQIDAINAKTMQAANGKAQEGESVSDLQRMLKEYFGGRSAEQRQKDAILNIGAALAAGKSPRFMDNLGSAVSSAAIYDRDADKGNKKEALDMMLKDQEQQNKNAYQQGELGLGAEKNRIEWANNSVARLNATRARANDASELKGLQAAHRALKAEADLAQKSGTDASPYIIKMAEISAAIGKMGGITPTTAPASNTEAAGWSLWGVN